MTGVAFLPGELVGASLVVEFAWGADLTADPATWTWTDATADYQQIPGIKITIGRDAENSTAQPASCTAVFRDTNKSYSQYDPLGPNWPNVREGTPFRTRLIISATSYTRFQGRVISFNPTPLGKGDDCLVTMVAAGITRILARPAAPAPSVLRSFVPSTSPIAYWPLEDGIRSTQFASGLQGGTALTIAPSPAAPWKLATIATAPGSGPLPDFASGPVTSGVSFADGPVVGCSASGWTAACTMWMTAHDIPGDADLEVCRLDLDASGTWKNILVFITSTLGTFAIKGTRPDGTQDSAIAYVPGTSIYDGVWHTWQWSCAQSGGNVNFTLWRDGTSVATASLAATLGPIINCHLNAEFQQQYSLGHLAIWNSTAVITGLSDAGAGNPGETPGARLARVCAAAGIQFTQLGFYDPTVTCGPQESGASLLAVARSAETVEAGYLYDGLSDGLSFVGISQRYDQFGVFTIDGTATTLGQPLEIQQPFLPKYDDYARVNKATVKRLNGVTITAEDQTGQLGTTAVGDYELQLSNVNLASDFTVIDRANWEVHKGTTFGPRWPQINLNVRTIPSRAAAIAGMYPSQAFTVKIPTNYQAWYGKEDLFLTAEGWTETLSDRVWLISLNCNSMDPWYVWKIGDPDRGRLGTSGHTLASSALAGATSLSLATPTGRPLWTTAAADFPMNLAIDGIKVVVSAITGSSSPQTATVTATTKALSAGKPVTIWKNGVLKL